MVGPISRKSHSRPRGVLRMLRSFGRRNDGTVAIEYAFVLGPFLLMLLAIMQTALVFFAGQTLETAVASSARLILTGQAQTSGMNQASFKAAVCARIFGLFDCQNGVTVDVQKYSTFASADLNRPVDSQGKVKPGQYNPGGPCEIVVVRLIYEFPVVSMAGFDLSDMKNGKRLLVATTVFRNEPYQGTCS